MNQAIDPIKLKAAAEYLEWVLRQYPDEPVIQGLLDSLLPLIEDARAERVREPAGRIPCEYNFADGAYIPFNNPSVDAAYVKFSTEMGGGLSEEDKRDLERLEEMRRAMKL